MGENSPVGEGERVEVRLGPKAKTSRQPAEAVCLDGALLY